MLKSPTSSLRYYATDKIQSAYSGILYDAKGEIDQASFNQTSARKLGRDLKGLIEKIPEDIHNGALEGYPGFRQLTQEEEQEFMLGLKD